MKKLTAFCILSLLFFSFGSFAQKTYILKQNLPIGKKYDFSMLSDQIINQKIGDQKMALTQNIGTDYTFSIRNGDRSEKDIEVIYNRIYMKSTASGNVMTMDSDDQDTTKQNPFKGIKGASFGMTMAPDGSIKSISGIDRMLNTMASNMTKDSTLIQGTKTALSKQFNTEGLKQLMESSLKIYPENPVKIGDSWTVDTKMQMIMPIETNTKYTLKAVKDGVAYLGVNGTLIAKGSFEAMGNQMETDLNGTNTGDAELDMKTGLILKSHLRIELLGKVKSMGQNIDFELQGINKITGKEIN